MNLYHRLYTLTDLNELLSIDDAVISSIVVLLIENGDLNNGNA
jgi:hypothetical protein